MAKPVGGEWLEDEVSGLKQLGVNHIVSLLEVHEEREVDLGLEAELCAKHGLRFTSFPIPDRGLPETEPAKSLAHELCEEVSEGAHLVIHCRAGIGRTGIVASAVLINSGYSARESLEAVSKARGVEVPDTEEQAEWVNSIERSGM